MATKRLKTVVWDAEAEQLKALNDQQFWADTDNTKNFEDIEVGGGSGPTNAIGDVDDENNGTKIVVDDNAEVIEVHNLPAASGGESLLVIDTGTKQVKIGDPLPVVESGTYTPTILFTNESFTLRKCTYTRIGNIVTVYGYMSYSSASLSNITVIISLPTGTISNQEDLNGILETQNSGPQGIEQNEFNGDPILNGARIIFSDGAGDSGDIAFTFQYEITPPTP